MEDHLLMMLMYNREDLSQLIMTLVKQCWRIVKDIEYTLIQGNTFRLPHKKALAKFSVRWFVVLVDVAEAPRGGLKKQRHYSGKKKKHTNTTRLVVDKDGRIICVHTEKGRKHDFRVFKESNVHIHPEKHAQPIQAIRE